jgi:hypothetical protein
MGLRPDALYSAIFEDVRHYLPLGPVAPSKLPPDASYKQFVSTSLLYDVVRKWIPEDSRAADLAAKEKFLASNKKCRDWSLECRDEGDALLWGEFKDSLYWFFHHRDQTPIISSYEDILSSGRVGPGSALGANGNSMYAKLFASKLTVTTPMLYEMYKHYLMSLPTWSEAECFRRSEFGEFEVVGGSRCSFVPKTRDTSRMICVEPSLNMFIQLGFGALLEERLYKLFNISLETQPQKNRRLARLGSRDGSFSTIDLSSASDSLSLRMLQNVLPDWVFKTLLELRSSKTTLDGEDVPLFMISTMGNGFTFPLQTIMFSCLIRAAYSVSGKEILDGRIVRDESGMIRYGPNDYNWCCFGDDLIVETAVYRNVLRLLRLIGCEVNSSKTFFEGPFRESCGTDWFYGQPARSVFIKALRSPQDVFVAINLLNEWSAYTGIPLQNGVRLLFEWLNPANKQILVPNEESADAGVRVPSAYLSRLPRRNRNGTIIYRAYTAMPKQVRCVGDSLLFPRGVKKLIYNPSGLMMSFLRGEWSGRKGSNPFTMSIRRPDRQRYRRKTRVSPWWDYYPRDTSTNGCEVSWQQWETAVLINLSNP